MPNHTSPNLTSAMRMLRRVGSSVPEKPHRPMCEICQRVTSLTGLDRPPLTATPKLFEWPVLLENADGLKPGNPYEMQPLPATALPTMWGLPETQTPEQTCEKSSTSIR